MILLDTNALIWLLASHPRAAALEAAKRRLVLSPIALLELAFLEEVGRVQLVEGAAVADIARDARWRLDDPPLGDVCAAALPIQWTRDPFDRLLVAHARLRRWPLATGDRRVLAQLRPEEVVAL